MGGIIRNESMSYTCFECGASFGHWSKSRLGQDFGGDSLALHLKQTGHARWGDVDQHHSEELDYSVSGENVGRLTARYKSRRTGEVVARCGCGGANVAVPADQWGEARHCGAEYEVLDSSMAMHAVLDQTGEATWLVVNVPGDVSSSEVADVLAQSGVSARVHQRGPLSSYQVADIHSFPEAVPALHEMISLAPKHIRATPGWISRPRISWIGMKRHCGCMISGYRADDPSYLRTTMRYSGMKGEAKGRFLREYPYCMLCGEASERVDHDHVTGLVRGALCSDCNVLLGPLEKVCEPGWPLGPQAPPKRDPEFLRRDSFPQRPLWYKRALSYIYHSEQVVLAAYGVQVS